MKKHFMKLSAAALAISMIVGMGTTSFAAGIIVNGASDTQNPHELGAIHLEEGGNVSGAGGLGGVIHIAVGESVTLHAAQLMYAITHSEQDLQKIAYSNPDGIVDIQMGELVSYDASTMRLYCRPYTFTGKAEGTFVFSYGSGPYGVEEYKIVVGPGKSTAASDMEAEPKGDAAPNPQENETASAVPSANGLSYTIQSGDTFGCLALNYFGDMNVWPAIYSYNAQAIASTLNKQIYVGMEIVIPSAIQYKGQTLSVIAPAVAGAGEELYTVQLGDSYASIAQEHFGDMSRYQEIFDRNSDRLKDIHTLYAGQILVLPAK